MISFANLTYFVVVAEELSFSKAAKRLFVTQQNVSNTIRNMEAEYNLCLFNRSVSGVTLTEAGQCFYNHARIMLSQKEQMDRQLADIRSQETGALTIAAPVSFGQYLLPDIISDFKSSHPMVELNVQQLRSDQIMEHLKNGRIQIGLGLNLYDPALSSVKLYNESFYLVISKQLLNEYYSPEQQKKFLNRESVMISEFSECSFIICDAMPWDTHFFHHGFFASFEPKISVRTSNFLMMIELCTRSLGATVIMESFKKEVMKKDQAESLVLIPVRSKALQVYDMVISYNKNNFLQQSAKDFLHTAIRDLSHTEDPGDIMF